MNAKETSGSPDCRRPVLLLTGAGGLPGRYVAGQFEDFRIVTLGAEERCDIRCDLSSQTPMLPFSHIDLVVHCARTEDPGQASEVNSGWTRRLLEGLSSVDVGAFVMVGSAEIYGKESGEDIDESSPTWPSGEIGISWLEAERQVAAAFKDKSTIVSLLRPVTMFGSGMEGWAASMFGDVIAGRYIHVRGSDGRLSLVMALDVARAVRAVWQTGGVFNVSDGRSCTWLELAEAMSANAGKHHRMTALPAKWASLLSAPASIFPALRSSLGKDAIRRRSQTLTFSSEKLRNLTGLSFYPAIEVISRRHSGYPYEET